MSSRSSWSKESTLGAFNQQQYPVAFLEASSESPQFRSTPVISILFDHSRSFMVRLRSFRARSLTHHIITYSYIP
jgi:hypothetical protein